MNSFTGEDEKERQHERNVLCQNADSPQINCDNVHSLIQIVHFIRLLLAHLLTTEIKYKS